MEIYCVDCNEILCSTCHTLEHGEYDWQDVDEIYDEFRNTIKEDVPLVLNTEDTLQYGVTALESDAKQANDDMTGNENDLSEVAEYITRHVDEVVIRLR